MAFQYKVLPFGQSLAPSTFTRCMDAVLSPLRQMGIHILNYLNDWLILAQLQVVLISHKTLLLSHINCLGLRVNFAKSILSPSQRVSFQGSEQSVLTEGDACAGKNEPDMLSTVQMTATVSAERAMTIQPHVVSFKEGTARPLKAFQRMLGLMAPASPVLQLCLLHMRPIRFWLK